MVDYFIGTIKIVTEHEVIVDIGNIAFSLQVAKAYDCIQDQPTKIYIHMHWNTENGPSLFGFIHKEERVLFKSIISCSGIGPKIALSILSDLGVQKFLHAITTGDDQTLSKVNGIGKKKAEHIVVQLKHKISDLIESGTIDMPTIQEVSHLHDISLALQSLHYSRQEIGKAMEYVKINMKADEATFDSLLRQALSYLSKQL